MYRLTQQQQPRKQDVVTKELQEVFYSSGPPSTRDEDDPPVVLLARYASAPDLSTPGRNNVMQLTTVSRHCHHYDARTARSPRRFRLRQKKQDQSQQQQQEQQRESASQRQPARSVWKRISHIASRDRNDGNYDEDQASVSSFRSWLSASSSSRRRGSTGNTAGAKRTSMRRNTITTHYHDPTDDKPTRQSRLERFRSFHSSSASPSWRKKRTKEPSHDQVIADFFDDQSLPSEPDYAATRQRRLFGAYKASTSTGDTLTSWKNSKNTLSFRRISRRSQPAVSTNMSDVDDNNDNDDDEITIGSDFFPPSSSALVARSSDLDVVLSGTSSIYVPGSETKQEDHDSKEKPKQNNRSRLAGLFLSGHRRRKTQTDDDKDGLLSTLNDFPTTRNFDTDKDDREDDDLDAELAQINNATPRSPRSAAATFDRWSPIPVDPSHMIMLPGTPLPAPPRRVRSLDAFHEEMDKLSESSDDDGKMHVVSLGLVGRIGSPCHHHPQDKGEDDAGFNSLASEESKRDDYGKKGKRRTSNQQGDIHSDGDDSSVLSLLSSLLMTWATESSNKLGMDDSDELHDRSCHAPIQLSNGRILRSCLKKPALERSSSSSPSPKLRNSVTFSVVQVREFERTVGDNPSCSTGPAISLGWSYHSTPDIAVEDHAQLPKRTKRQFHLPPAKRTTLLTEEWEVPEQDIRQARREATYIQYCREKTAFTGGRRDLSGKALRRQGQAVATPEQQQQQQQQQAVVSRLQQATTAPQRPEPDQTATTQPSRFRRCNSLEDYGPSAAAVSIRRSISLGRSSINADENDGFLPSSSRFDIGEAGTSTIPAPPRRKPSGQLLEV